MSKIELITRRNCEACTVMLHNLADVLNEVNAEITIKVVPVSTININILPELNIKAYPTLIIKKEDKEVARLEGTFPKKYLIEVINKIN